MCIEEWKDQESVEAVFGSMSQEQEDTWMVLLAQKPESARYNRM